MRYVSVTHIDSKTKVPVHKAPMKYGPAFPDIKGLSIEWWNASSWPITHPDQFPRFYGTCDNDANLVADLDSNGIIEIDIPEAEYISRREEEMKARLPSKATPAKIRLTLIEYGLLAPIETFIEALEEPMKTKVKTQWEYSTEMDKFNPTIKKLAGFLNIDEDTLDDIFVRANDTSIDQYMAEEGTEEEPTT